MNCLKHGNHEADGVCSVSGNSYCAEELVEVDGKLIGRDILSRLSVTSGNEPSQIRQPILIVNTVSAVASPSSEAHSTRQAPALSIALPPLKSKITAGLLALLLGGLGVHKFYLGKWGQGILFFIFCLTGIPGVIAAFQGIRYLTMRDHEWAQRCRYGA
jgi:Predicted membrane protein